MNIGSTVKISILKYVSHLCVQIAKDPPEQEAETFIISAELPGFLNVVTI